MSKGALFQWRVLVTELKRFDNIGLRKLRSTGQKMLCWLASDKVMGGGRSGILVVSVSIGAEVSVSEVITIGVRVC